MATLAEAVHDALVAEMISTAAAPSAPTDASDLLRADMADARAAGLAETQRRLRCAEAAVAPLHLDLPAHLAGAPELLTVEQLRGALNARIAQLRALSCWLDIQQAELARLCALLKEAIQ